VTAVGASGSWHRRFRPHRPSPAHRPRPPSPSSSSDLELTLKAIVELARDRQISFPRFLALLLAYVWIRPWKRPFVSGALLITVLGLLAKVLMGSG
jgi:hypothetical protein